MNFMFTKLQYYSPFFLTSFLTNKPPIMIPFFTHHKNKDSTYLIVDQVFSESDSVRRFVQVFFLEEGSKLLCTIHKKRCQNIN